MQSKEIVEKFIAFYKERDHVQIPNVSLLPENDPTLLYVNSGMFPLVPYLSGEKHPSGKRLVNIQRCLRFDDLQDIGDKTHTLAFHMIGNWSLGDYFKSEQLSWAYQFLIEELKLDPKKLVTTIFSGDENAPADEESVPLVKEIYKKYGVSAALDKNIWLYNSKQGNWWQRGNAIGELGGPSSEVFYYLGEGDPSGLSPEEHERDFVEIGNSVFMEYKRTKSGWEPLPQANVDFGGGIERLAMAVQGKADIFQTDSFYPIIQKIEELSDKKYLSDPMVTENMRILADHMRSAVLIAMDGVLPSNKDQGYVLRRLLRRMIRSGRKLSVNRDISVNLIPIVADIFGWLYPEISEKQDGMKEMFAEEEVKFLKNLDSAKRFILKNSKKILVDMPDGSLEYADSKDLARISFDLFQTNGIPIEVFIYEIQRAFSETVYPDNYTKLIDDEFHRLFQEHQEKSRSGANQKFTGGLADHSEKTIRYHTATHLLHMALRKVLGDDVLQRGSNITGERLRFDFNYESKLTEEQVSNIEKIVNDAIDKGYTVNFEMLSIKKAEASGAIHAFNEKYGDKVKVYYIGDTMETAISKEFCGGPHVVNVSEIGHIKIYKQDKIGKGLMRVYAK